MELDDLISIGTIGLIKGINTFNLDKNVRLATYASRCIENEILMYLRSTKKLGAEVYLNEPIGKDKDDNEISLIDILENDEKNIEEEIDFKLKIKTSDEYLTSEKDIIKKVIKDFNEEEFNMYMTNYNVELLALSKYFLDKIPNIFSIKYETKYEKCIFYASEIEEITKND